MARNAVAAPPAAATPWHARPAWRAAGAVALIYLAARVVTTALFVLASNLAPAEGRYGASPGLDKLFLGWDGQWYWLIGESGYPSDLPRTETGAVKENAWAFMPVFPLLARTLGTVLGGWPSAALVIVLCAGYGACLLLFHLWRSQLDERSALWAVAFVAAGPLAGLFQVAYAEPLFLLLLAGALLAVQRRRFGWAYPLVALAGLTRPGILAFALFLALLLIVRWFHRRNDPLSTRDVTHLVALAALATVVGFAWQVIAGIVTGDASAYLDTELAWRQAWGFGESGFWPFQGWFEGAAFWFGTAWSLPVLLGYAAAVAIVLAVAALLMFDPRVRSTGIEVRLWSASYLLYLLAVFFPQSSVFRLLFPLSPLAGALAVPRSRAWRIGVLAVGVALQWWWIWNMYGIGRNFWQIP